MTPSSGETMFGVTRRKMSAEDCTRADRIARLHGASFVCATRAGTGWRGWFCAPNRGEPFDRELAREVLAAVRAAGLTAWPEGEVTP